MPNVHGDDSVQCVIPGKIERSDDTTDQNREDRVATEFVARRMQARLRPRMCIGECGC